MLTRFSIAKFSNIFIRFQFGVYEFHELSSYQKSDYLLRSETEKIYHLSEIQLELKIILLKKLAPFCLLL